MGGITLHVFGRPELVQKFARLSNELPSLVTAEMKNQMVMLADYVRTHKLSGDPLNRRTGKLSRSINGNAELVGRTVVGTVGSKGVPYAAVHELGLTVQVPSHQRQISMVFGRPVLPHDIEVKAYEARYPMRAFLKPSLEENRSKIMDALRDAVTGAMNGET